MKKIYILIPIIFVSILAIVFQSNNEVSMPKELWKLHGEACYSGNAKECTMVGIIYMKGNVISKDYTKAKELFNKACNDGNGWGCSKLGDMYYNGILSKKDEFKALEFYSKACELDSSICSLYNSIKMLTSLKLKL